MMRTWEEVEGKVEAETVRRRRMVKAFRRA